MNFAKLRISPPKKREKTTASHQSSPFWSFYNTKLPPKKKRRCWVRVTGGPPACIRSKQELCTRRSWRVLRHTTRPVSASIRHRQTSARALSFTPSLLTCSRSLPPCLPLSRASSVGEWNQLPKKKKKKRDPQKKKPGNTDRQTDG